MVFTRKDGDFHGRTVSLPEAILLLNWWNFLKTVIGSDPIQESIPCFRVIVPWKIFFFIHGVCGKKHPIFAEHIDMSFIPNWQGVKWRLWRKNRCERPLETVITVILMEQYTYTYYIYNIYITLYIRWFSRNHMDISKNRGTPKSSILIGFSIINHPFWGTPIFGNNHMINQYL